MIRKKKEVKTDMKGEFLTELVERYAYWHGLGNAEADEYAASYERMIATHTMPEEKE